MTVFTCKGCGRPTNSVCCELNRGEPPNHCYAAWEDGKWVKGCGFDKAPTAFLKAYAAHLITNRPVSDFSKREAESLTTRPQKERGRE